MDENLEFHIKVLYKSLLEMKIIIPENVTLSAENCQIDIPKFLKAISGTPVDNYSYIYILF